MCQQLGHLINLFRKLVLNTQNQSTKQGNHVIYELYKQTGKCIQFIK